MCALSTLLTQGNSGANSSLHFAELAQLVERRLAKAKVAGSNPVFRSNLSPRNYVGFGGFCFSGVAASLFCVGQFRGSVFIKTARNLANNGFKNRRSPGRMKLRVTRDGVKLGVRVQILLRRRQSALG